jgi:hypothetical protein
MTMGFFKKSFFLFVLLCWTCIASSSSLFVLRKNQQRPLLPAVSHRPRNYTAHGANIQGQDDHSWQELPSRIEDGIYSRLARFKLGWAQFQVNCFLLAIHVVLEMQWERAVLTKLPPHLIGMLVRTSLKRKVSPKIIRLVGLELEDRIHRGEYKFGDLTRTVGCVLTRKDEYTFGDITQFAVSQYTGKDEYHFGDLTKASVSKYTEKKEYRFGDITRTTVSRLTQKESYEFGDISKAIAGRIAGSDEYIFGDVTRMVLGNLTGKKKYRYGEITRRALRQLQKETDSSSKYHADLERELKELS